ncbi:Glutamine synthetase [Rickettsiales bacterium Ac37b]|nr:Glutamine synthetase [Rickettsiales bacterium Ac37b]
MSNTDQDLFFTLLKEHEIEFIDFRFTDSVGKWHHTSYFVDAINETNLRDGLPFDGSSIAGWKEVNESDMLLIPDIKTAFVDPFSASPTLVVYCDVFDPSTKSNYTRDPRSTAKRAEAYLETTKIANKAVFGPEIEFFIFDDIRFKVSSNKISVEIDSEEGPYNSDKRYEAGNNGHRPKIKGGYFPVQPIDSLSDIRAEMLLQLKSIGVKPIVHHHEVAPGQCELSFVFDTLTNTADNVQKCKYVIQNVAHSYAKTASFMPKPIKDDNGSGMHLHQSLWQDANPLFNGNEYSGLSELCLYYIGGIIKHARAISAFSNSTTNSYKRLVPCFEAPTLLAYSASNRSAAIRIPYVSSKEATRIEVRFPDPSSNPYYTFAAMLMAGLDGIENKIHPGQAFEENLYNISQDKISSILSTPTSLRESLQALKDDRDFLKKGNVFSDEQLDAYIELKMKEINEVERTPHPIEFLLYYSA